MEMVVNLLNPILAYSYSLIGFRQQKQPKFRPKVT